MRMVLTNECRDQAAANLANVFRYEPNGGPKLTGNTDAKLRVHVRIIIRVSRGDEVVVNIAALHAVQDVQKENTRADCGILE